jgi:arylsulfatase A-like enzyme/Flp pilus assembly protein TadD
MFTARFFLIFSILIILSTAGSVLSQPVSGGESYNTILITLDTVRADKLGCYGHSGIKTPTLDRIAQEGLLFDQMFCPVPMTLPSHTSLLTGMNPTSHGIRINAGGKLSEAVTTLAEAFKHKGYRTGAFISSVVLKSRFGLNQGFDVYEDSWPSVMGQVESPERSGKEISDSTIRWLRKDTGKPFFAWLHYFDPHYPYTPPDPFGKSAETAYEGEIEYVDNQLQRVIGWLGKQGKLSKTMIVIVGDHGESLGEHNEQQHGLLIYRPTMHVPCMIWCPGLMKEHKIIHTPASLIDIMPTITSRLGFDQAEQIDGIDVISLSGNNKTARKIYGESEWSRLGFNWAPLSSIRTDEWVFVESPDPELFNWTEDPQERRNLYSQNPDIVKMFRRELQDIRTKTAGYTPETVFLDDETTRQLESLGYVNLKTDNVVYEDLSTMKNPRDMVIVFNTLTIARHKITMRDFSIAVTLLLDILQTNPDSTEIHASLAQAYHDMGSFADAEKHFRTSLQYDPDDKEKLVALADSLRSQRKISEAKSVLEKTVHLYPDFWKPHSKLGVMFSRLKNESKAMHHLRRAIELNPTLANNHSNLGNSLMHFGRFNEAIAPLYKALDCDPGFEKAHRVLWRALIHSGRKNEAAQALCQAHSIFPGDLEIANRMAWYMAVLSGSSIYDPEAALQLAMDCVAREPGNPLHHDVLAAAYAALGDFNAAMESEQNAILAADSTGRPAIANTFRQRLNMYRNYRPYTEPG